MASFYLSLLPRYDLVLSPAQIRSRQCTVCFHIFKLRYAGSKVPGAEPLIRTAGERTQATRHVSQLACSHCFFCKASHWWHPDTCQPWMTLIKILPVCSHQGLTLFFTPVMAHVDFSWHPLPRTADQLQTTPSSYCANKSFHCLFG